MKWQGYRTFREYRIHCATCRKNKSYQVNINPAGLWICTRTATDIHLLRAQIIGTSLHRPAERLQVMLDHHLQLTPPILQLQEQWHMQRAQ